MLAQVPQKDGLLYIAICEHLAIRTLFAAPSDAEAIAKARDELSPAEITCDSTMASAARLAGAAVTPLTNEELLLLAVAAVMPAIRLTVAPAAAMSTDLMRFGLACAGFAWAKVWKTMNGRLFEVNARRRGKVETLTLVVQPEGFEPGPGFGLLEPDVEIAADGETPQVINIVGDGRLSLVCMRPAPRVRPLLLRALGGEHFPIGISCRRGGPLLCAHEVRLLTAVLECIRDAGPQGLPASAEVDGQRVSLTRHPHEQLLLLTPRGTA